MPMKGYGHINISNVNSNMSECITLTYSIKDVGNQTKARKLKKELDDLTDADAGSASIAITSIDTEDEKCDMKYQLRTCDSEKKAREYKGVIDKFLSKKGGQTTLDDVE